MTNVQLFILYLVLVNIMAFIMYAWDKKKAMKGKYRISEASLLSYSLLGGGIGSYLGMYTCHHKTKKTKFKVLVPLNSVIFILIVVFLILK